ncbi:MAG: PHP domain-containing protein, partial [Proteobacteria bacterium]|nr:PHP domain-containing protein [Pseudomonadota bacterium]
MAGRGLRLVKADLHVHTPASSCFRGEITPEDLVESAVSAGLEALAITDHNTGAWIDQIKDAARDK